MPRHPGEEARHARAHHVMQRRDAVGRGGERLEQCRRQVPLAPALHLARDRGEALGAAEMRLEPALRHLLLVLGRHAGDHRHHALGREIVNELRPRLVEPGTPTNGGLGSIGAKGKKENTAKAAFVDPLFGFGSDNLHRVLPRTASEEEIGAIQAATNWPGHVAQSDAVGSNNKFVLTTGSTYCAKPRVGV